jgi:hypothetical protein
VAGAVETGGEAPVDPAAVAPARPAAAGGRPFTAFFRAGALPLGTAFLRTAGGFRPLVGRLGRPVAAGGGVDTSAPGADGDREGGADVEVAGELAGGDAGSRVAGPGVAGAADAVESDPGRSVTGSAVPALDDRTELAHTPRDRRQHGDLVGLAHGLLRIGRLTVDPDPAGVEHSTESVAVAGPSLEEHVAHRGARDDITGDAGSITR